MTHTIGQIIEFEYHGRFVKGKVLSFTKQSVTVELMTDYIGKNEDWYAGELKLFFKALMNNEKQVKEEIEKL